MFLAGRFHCCQNFVDSAWLTSPSVRTVLSLDNHSILMQANKLQCCPDCESMSTEAMYSSMFEKGSNGPTEIQSFTESCFFKLNLKIGSLMV